MHCTDEHTAGVDAHHGARRQVGDGYAGLADQFIRLVVLVIEEAKNELKIAGQLNPGPWIEHSVNVGIAARNIAQKVSGMDGDKATHL